jgi:hypothetical protein
MDKRGQMLVAEFGRERAKQANSRTLWQNTGDAMWPYVQVDAEFTPGTQRMREILDMTPTLDMKDMVSGFKQVLMPSGQTFFVIQPEASSVLSDSSHRYLSYLTAAAHEKIQGSNLSLKYDEVLISLITFGPAGVYSEWTKKKGLNYKVPKIGSYVLIEDDSENVVGSIHEYKMSATEAYKKWPETCGVKVKQAAESEDHAYDDFWFLYKVVPNDHINPLMSHKLKKNMPYMAIIANKAEKCIVEEGGFPENPYAFARWMRPEYEKDGRGIGTEMLPQIKILYQMTKDYRDCGNRYNHPPKQGLIDSVEGQVDVRPDAMNWVTQIDAIRSLEDGMKGNFPITEKTLQDQRSIIDRAFYKDAFDPLSDLTGDRRTTIEIQERIRGTLKKLGPPVTRVWHEQLTRVIERSIMLLIRNGEVEAPPAELSGMGFGIEYVGPLALALKSEQAKGFQEWINFLGGVNQAFPEQYVGDNIDFDDALPRIGRTFGVNTEDISSAEERDAKRMKRAEALEKRQQMEAAMAMSKAYKDGSGAAEDGSPAEKLMQEAV